MAAANTVRAVTTAICTIWTMNGANQAGKFIKSRQIPIEISPVLRDLITVIFCY